jgi:hypothetical protein
MNLTGHISKQLREVYFGGNWSASALKENLQDLTWQQATTQVESLNTIAALVFHINYYVNAILKVLQGHSLDAHDKYSFNLPILSNQAEWEKLQEKTFSDAEKLAACVEALPESKLWQLFSAEKYGDYYRNIHGVIEHTHYHLGQIVLIKKMLTSANHNSVRQLPTD